MYPRNYSLTVNDRFLLVFNKGVQGARKLLLKRVLVNTKIVKIHDPTILPLKGVVLESDR